MSDDVTRASAQSSKGIERERTVGTPMDLNREHWSAPPGAWRGYGTIGARAYSTAMMRPGRCNHMRPCHV